MSRAAVWCRSTCCLKRVNALIVGGIGMRPLMGFRQVGINVFHDDQRAEIAPVVYDLISGKLRKSEMIKSAVAASNNN